MAGFLCEVSSRSSHPMYKNGGAHGADMILCILRAYKFVYWFIDYCQIFNFQPKMTAVIL